ncbi:kinase-like domain-containing protein [Mycena metata]|uniref:Kinase-like domain-containing protein n=1 Tax=Mycena metata TaxID=1033252 RepID=A0AAD7KL42_9AGAR|nr:kinase-like domain-containing protein [Mycena metata]
MFIPNPVPLALLPVKMPSRFQRRVGRIISTLLALNYFLYIAFQYVLGELIGKGSYAKVFLAMNATNGQLIAVKRVERPRTASDRASSHQLEMVEALKFESDTLKVHITFRPILPNPHTHCFPEDLEHPNIVQYLGFEQTQETLNIFLEYIPGGTIGSMIAKHGRFTQEVTKYFAAQILAGLEYLHSTGILHRDLKGDNILVEMSGVCKISDFGISKREDVQGQAFTNMRGTAYWMQVFFSSHGHYIDNIYRAPEILDSNNKRGYDSKVDVWSLGCVVVEMWTGQRPWAGEEFLPVMLKLYNGTPPPVPPEILADLSELALDFRNECFTINPQARPTAVILRNHPYLQPTPGWVFQVSEIERSTARRANGRKRDQGSHRHRNSSVPASHHRRSATEEIPPMPTRPNGSMVTARPSDHLRLPPNDDNSTLRPGSRRRHTSRASSNEPPPIVYITPSPARASSRSSVSPGTSATSESTRASGSLRSRKSFYIANPDPDDHEPRESFVYHPPPLPSGDTLRSSPPQLSERRRKELQSRASVADFKSEERRLPSASASAQQLASRLATASSRQSTSSRAESYSDSDSDSNTGSMWKKPPVDLANSKSSSSSKSNKFAKRRSIIESQRESTWAPRPGGFGQARRGQFF